MIINKLSSLWLKQLHLEFEDFCWQYKIRLTSPVFEISKAEKTFGSWDAARRTIQISGVLIRDYSWDVTLNILKHEMAHQICSEIFYSHEVPHGPDFIRACELIGLPKAYQSAGGDLSTEICSEDTGSRITKKARQYISKIEKLLALAESANEHEAVLAMEKANEIMLKYNISQLSSHEDINYTYTIINRKKKIIASYQRDICGILRDFFHVKIIYTRMYEPVVDQSHKTIEIFGSSENVAVAEYCYYFLENQLSTLWNRKKQQYTGNKQTIKNSYYLGILHGFRDKLQKQKDDFAHKFTEKGEVVAGNKDGTDLMVVDDKMIDQYISVRFPRLSTARRGGVRINEDTYSDGVVDGGKINLHKGVSKNSGNQGKYLC